MYVYFSSFIIVLVKVWMN